MYVKDIIPVISYGQFSKPFTSFLENYSDNSDIRLYLTLLKNKWILSTDELFEQIDSTLKKTHNVGIKYLLLSDKLDVAKNLTKRELNKKLYRKLIREFKKIPQDFRSIIGKGLKSNNAYTKEYSSKEFRMWSDIYKKDELDTAVNLHAEAVKMLNLLQIEQKRKSLPKEEISNKIERLCNIFVEASENAKIYPHPTFILSGLNNAAWYIMKTNLEKAHDISLKLAYYCAFYLEDAHQMLNYLDTIINVLKTTQDPLYFVSGKIFLYFFKKLTETKNEKQNAFYKQKQYILKYVYHDYEQSRVNKSIKNSKGLKTFLNDKIKKPNDFAKKSHLAASVLYPILNGQTEKINRATIEKIINTLDLNISYENPKVLNEILIFQKQEMGFQLNWSHFINYATYEREKIILKNYLTAVFLKKFDIGPFINFDPDRLYDYIFENKYRILFFNTVYENMNPFYKARRDIADKFIDEIEANKSVSRFIHFLSCIKGTKNHELVAQLFRQYTRYRMVDWKFSVEDVLKTRQKDPDHSIILEFSDKLKLSELFLYLAYWSLGPERKEVLFLLNKI